MDSRPVAVPKASPDPFPELCAYLQPFVRVLRRDQTMRSAKRYVTGLLSDLERKNCDTIAAGVAGTTSGRLQPLSKQLVALHVHRATGNPTETRVSQSRVSTGPEGWLLAKRPIPGQEGDCQDLVMWYIDTNQTTSFRPRRN